ncbi:hypothetical protein BH11ARM2_BH11ARM2_02740 [soil metagenome]
MIALTGGIATGKSTVLRALENLGARTVSADAIVRAMYEEPWVQDRLAAITGLANPILPRDAAPIILGNPEKMRRYGAIFHQPALERILASGADVAEVPLLVESCSMGLFERVWGTVCAPEAQYERLIARLHDPEAAKRFLDAQFSSRVKAAFCETVIRTDEPFQHVVTRVSQVWQLRVAEAENLCYTRVA